MSDAVCFVEKMMGFFSFAGSTKGASLLYPLMSWLCFGSSGVYMIVHYYKENRNVSSKNNMQMKMIFIEVVSKFVVATIGTSVSATRGRAFFDLLDKFSVFDELTLGERCPSNACAQTLYMLHVTLLFVHNFSWTWVTEDIPFYILFVWHVYCILTLLSFVQYVNYARMVRERYKLANSIFKSSLTERFSPGTKYMYPKELVGLFIQLRGLTEEVKTYYAYHAILVIVESVLILITNVTALTANHINGSTPSTEYTHLIGHCSMRLMFLFYVVRETHNTKLEANNTVLIGHELLINTSDITTTKYLEVIVLNCWNHPIVFDVHDFFDLDYKLLQSIIASVVTYVVVLVQIQLAIMDI